MTLAMSWIFFPPIPARGWERAVAAVLYATLSLLLLRDAPVWLTWRSTVVPAFCINLLALMRFAGFAEMSVAPDLLDTRARLVATSAHPGGKRCPLDMIERLCGLTLIGSVAEECGLSAWGEGGELLWHRPMSVGPIAAADCAAGRLYVASHSEHTVLELGKDGAELAEVALPRNANVIQSLGDRKVLVQTEGRDLIRVDFASRSLDVLASLDNTNDFGFDPETGRIAIGRDGQMEILNLRTGERVSETRLPEGPGFRLSRMAWCLEARVLVASDFRTGRIYSFDSDDLRPVGEADLRPGVRNMACRGMRLFVANYVTGLLTVLDPLTLRVVDRVYAGPRMRAVWIDPSTGRSSPRLRSGPSSIPRRDHRRARPTSRGTKLRGSLGLSPALLRDLGRTPCHCRQRTSGPSRRGSFAGSWQSWRAVTFGSPISPSS